MPEENEQECGHCTRVKLIHAKLLELGYNNTLEEIYMIDELLRVNCFPHLIRLVADTEVLLSAYDGLSDEDEILGHYERQIEDDKTDEKSEE
jgi:hypothetical protein